MAKFLRYWAPFLAYLVLTFILSGISSPTIPFNVDSNLLHYPEFAVFSFLLVRAIHSGKQGLPSASVAASAVILSALWGLSDEVHQAFIPERVPDVGDLAHDVIGAAAGAGLFYLFLHFSNSAFRKEGL